MAIKGKIETGSRSPGFSLVESVVSLGVFSLLAVGILGLVLQLRRLAENNVHENTALTMAQGYVEQLRSLPYNELLAAANSSSAPLRLLSANGGGTVLTDGTGGALNNNEWTAETIFLDRDATGADTQPMRFRFRVDLVDVRPHTAAAANGVELSLVYEFERQDGLAGRTRRTLRTVRSVVPAY